MIDLHCHFLPFVDDGARSVAEALALARAAVADGIQCSVLTPHIHPGRWDNSFEALQCRFEAYRRALALQKIPLEIRLGAEIRVSPETIPHLEQRALPAIGRWAHHDLVLLELPPAQLPAGIANIVPAMQARGALPVIAHPERNRQVIDQWQRLEPLVANGALLQLTAGSLVGQFGEPAQLAAYRLIEAGWVTFVATDAHNLRYRPPVLSAAARVLADRYGPSAVQTLLFDHPQRLVRDARRPITDARILDADEIAAIMAAARTRAHRLLLMLVAEAGLRGSEVVRLRTKDIDLQGGTLRVLSTASRSSRVVPLSPRLRRSISERTSGHSEWLFPSPSRPGRPMSVQRAERLMRSAIEGAGVDSDDGFADLRRTFALRELRSGVTLERLQVLLGHRHLRSTLRYITVAPRTGSTSLTETVDRTARASSAMFIDRIA